MSWLTRLAGLMVLLTPAAWAVPPVSVFTTAYPPYAAPELPGEGVAVAMLRDMLAAEGLQLRVDFQPWARLATELKLGRYDVVLLAWPGDVERHGLVAGPPWFESRLGLFVRRGDWRPAGLRLDQAAGMRVGGVKDYAYPSALLHSGLRFEMAHSDEQNLRKLGAGRIDGVMLERAVGHYQLRRGGAGLDPQALLWQEPAWAEIPIYAAVVPGRPQSDRLATLLARGLQALKDSGRYRALVQQHQLDPVSEPRSRGNSRH